MAFWRGHVARNLPSRKMVGVGLLLCCPSRILLRLGPFVPKAASVWPDVWANRAFSSLLIFGRGVLLSVDHGLPALHLGAQPSLQGIAILLSRAVSCFNYF